MENKKDPIYQIKPSFGKSEAILSVIIIFSIIFSLSIFIFYPMIKSVFISVTSAMDVSVDITPYLNLLDFAFAAILAYSPFHTFKKMESDYKASAINLYKDSLEIVDVFAKKVPEIININFSDITSINPDRSMVTEDGDIEIGRASCRERV